MLTKHFMLHFHSKDLVDWIVIISVLAWNSVVCLCAEMTSFIQILFRSDVRQSFHSIQYFLTLFGILFLKRSILFIPPTITFILNMRVQVSFPNGNSYIFILVAFSQCSCKFATCAYAECYQNEKLERYKIP